MCVPPLSPHDRREINSNIPGGKSKGTIGRDDNVGDKVGVSTKSTASITIGIVLSSAGVSQSPDDDGLITRRRQQKVGVFGGGSKTGDPVVVSAEGSTKGKGFRDSGHLGGCRLLITKNWYCVF